MRRRQHEARRCRPSTAQVATDVGALGPRWRPSNACSARRNRASRIGDRLGHGDQSVSNAAHRFGPGLGSHTCVCCQVGSARREQRSDQACLVWIDRCNGSVDRSRRATDAQPADDRSPDVRHQRNQMDLHAAANLRREPGLTINVPTNTNATTPRIASTGPMLFAPLGAVACATGCPGSSTPRKAEKWPLAR